MRLIGTEQDALNWNEIGRLLLLVIYCSQGGCHIAQRYGVLVMSSRSRTTRRRSTVFRLGSVSLGSCRGRRDRSWWLCRRASDLD